MSSNAGYFEALGELLHSHGVYQPTLVVDLDRLDQNVDTLTGFLPEGMAYRIVAKSLPVPELIGHVRNRAKTDRLMTFNLPMLLDLVQEMPDADQLLGKPLPAAAFREFLVQAPKDAHRQVHWLIDTPARLSQYAKIAQEFVQNISVVLELDVGLHRGGFKVDDALGDALRHLRESNVMTFKGFMGYEPHLASIPNKLGWRKRAQQRTKAAYAGAIELAGTIFDAPSMDAIVRNIAGSPTFRMYGDTAIGNEVSVGSALVKPTDFDKELLKPFQPACFIATPVLKAVGITQIAGLEFADGLKNKAAPESAQSFFIHGGKWMAEPEYPAGLSYNAKFGRSSNQEMLNGPESLSLQPDDFVFFRPHQSEAVFLQFGGVLAL